MKDETTVLVVLFVLTITLAFIFFWLDFRIDELKRMTHKRFLELEEKIQRESET